MRGVMVSEKPKRRFWQIHLSTAMALMIVLSIQFYLGILPRRQSKGMDHMLGWPFNASALYPKFNSAGQNIQWAFEFYWGWLAMDVLINIGILLLVLLICERRNDRREAQRHE